MNQVQTLPTETERPARFSVEEFMGMAQEGAFELIPGKIELAEGVIVRMTPPNYPHTSTQRQVFLKLHEIFGDGLNGLIVAFELGSRLGPATVRLPDIAVFRDPGPISGLVAHDALWIAIEISDSSLDVDLGAKRANYAAAGVPHYWVVDIQARQVHVMHDPADGDYREGRTVDFGAPLPVPGTDAVVTID